MKKAFALALVIVLCLGLSACSGPSPTEVTNTFLQAVKDQDKEAQLNTYDITKNEEVLDFYNAFEDEKTGDEFTDTMMELLAKELPDKLSKFEFEVKNEKIDGDKATVEVAIKTYNTKDMFVNFTDKYIEDIKTLAMTATSEAELSDKKLTDLAIKRLTMELNAIKSDYSETVTLPLVKVDGDWKVAELDDDADFLNAIMGGMGDGAAYMENSM